jgi:hypothetical protein
MCANLLSHQTRLIRRLWRPKLLRRIFFVKAESELRQRRTRRILVVYAASLWGGPVAAPPPFLCEESLSRFRLH